MVDNDTVMKFGTCVECKTRESNPMPNNKRKHNLRCGQ